MSTTTIAASAPDAPATPGRMSGPATLAVVAGCLVTLLLAVLDSNIVTTAAVPIARDLHANGIGQVPWLVAGYLLAGTVVQPLYGKLADVIGVKPVFLGSLGLFLAGSLACGLATSMTELIVLRAVQGLGAGGLLSVTVVVLGHLKAEVDEAEDGEAGSGGAGFAGALVGLGMVVGPLVGSTVISHVSWRWIFFVNLPLGVLAFLLVARFLRLDFTPVRAPVDYVSALLLGLAAAAVVLTCEWGGQRYDWGSAPVLGLVALTVLLATAFWMRQRRSAAPFFSPRLLRNPVVRVVSALQFATGVGMAAGTVYFVIELQVVHHLAPFRAGLMMIPTAAGLGIGSLAAASMLRRGLPLRPVVVGGTALTAAMMAAMAALTAGSSLWLIGLLMLANGVGIGLTLGNEVIIVQASVDRSELGTATTGVRFVESLGTSLGAAAFGAVFLSLAGSSTSPGTVMHALDTVFAVSAVLLALAAVLATRLPDRVGR